MNYYTIIYGIGDIKMADSKIDFSFENLHFSCEGDNAWVEKQLNMVLSRIPVLLAVHKKGETIVEEVIDLKEEDVKEVRKRTPREVKMPKAKKQKLARVAEEKSAKEVKSMAPEVGAVKLPKKAKEPKIKVVKQSKVAGRPKGKAIEVEVGSMEGVAVHPQKKSKIGVKPLRKRKVAKKKSAKKTPLVAQLDSPLFQFITAKKATTNQVRKFLACAVFLTNTNAISRLTTSMVSKALKSNGIEKLQNASDCLNKNEKKGYCIKEGKEFVVAENGFLSIG